MKTKVDLLIVMAFVGALLFGGCATQPETITMQAPAGQQPQQVTMPKSTWTGAASGAQEDALAKEVALANRNAVTQANALAKQIQQANNNTMKQFDQVEGRLDKIQTTENKDLQVAQQALDKLEQLSAQQGSGQITLFFKTGSAELDRFQFQRLVGFLDYLARESRGRAVILVSIGSASAIGSPQINKKLSIERSEAPLPVINQYLVDIPHNFYKVTGFGDMYAPKNASLQVEHRYQSVRIIAAYDARNLPATPGS